VVAVLLGMGLGEDDWVGLAAGPGTGGRAAGWQAAVLTASHKPSRPKKNL
jgi:hypothetical protein